MTFTTESLGAPYIVDLSAACMIGVPAYRFGKAPRCVSQLEAHGSRLGAVVDRRELPHAASFDLRMRRAAVSETEARVTLLPIGLMPAFQAPPRAQPPGDDGTLAPRITD
jgi:hypothetical protein